MSKECWAEIWRLDYELGVKLGDPDPKAFATLASCATENGERLTTEEAVRRYTEAKEKRNV